MKPGTRLKLKLGQKLKLAPQLRQAISLLQLNRLELKAHVQNLLDANPLLERADDPDPAQDAQNDFEADDHGGDEPQVELGEDYGFDDLPDGFSVAGEVPNYDEFISDRADESLQHHLLWQMNLAGLSPTDEAIAKAIIYALDEQGYLRDSLDILRASLAPEYLVSLDEVRAVLERVQHFEPVGVASRDLAECLLLQLNTKPMTTPGLGIAQHIVQHHLDALGKIGPEALARQLGFDSDHFATAVRLVRSLDPHPCRNFGSERENYVAPDVYIARTEQGWRVSLNPDSDPGLRLNQTYMRLLRKSGGEDQQYLKDRLQEARWLISGLEMRNQTLLAVTAAIVKRQAGFLERGETAMRPLLQREIAAEISVHESTVSRATTQKYAHTPRGTIELKQFFSVGLSSDDGQEVSATAIKALLRQAIAAEPAGKPYSDQALSSHMAERGIRLARRTVAKYREQLGIPGSAQRRRSAGAR